MEEVYGRDRRVQRLITGYRCEIPECFEKAAWYVSTANASYHRCVKDTVALMEMKEFWELSLKRAEVIARRA